MRIIQKQTVKGVLHLVEANSTPPPSSSNTPTTTGWVSYSKSELTIEQGLTWKIPSIGTLKSWGSGSRIERSVALVCMQICGGKFIPSLTAKSQHSPEITYRTYSTSEIIAHGEADLSRRSRIGYPNHYNLTGTDASKIRLISNVCFSSFFVWCSKEHSVRLPDVR